MSNKTNKEVCRDLQPWHDAMPWSCCTTGWLTELERTSNKGVCGPGNDADWRWVCSKDLLTQRHALTNSIGSVNCMRPKCCWSWPVFSTDNSSLFRQLCLVFMCACVCTLSRKCSEREKESLWRMKCSALITAARMYER